MRNILLFPLTPVLLLCLRSSVADHLTTIPSWSALPPLLTFSPPFGAGCTESIVARAWSDTHNAEAVLAQINAHETYRDTDDRLVWSMEVLEAPRGLNVGSARHDAIEVQSRDVPSKPMAVYLASVSGTNGTMAKRYLHHPIHALDANVLALADQNGVLRGKVVFADNVFPLRLYACSKDAVSISGRELPQPVDLPGSDLVVDGQQDTCLKGILIYTVARPWYSALFRFLHAERIDALPDVRALHDAEGAAENVAFAADPILLMDVISLGSNARNDWCSLVGPLSLALVLTTVTLVISSICFCCSERKSRSCCACWDSLALRLPALGSCTEPIKKSVSTRLPRLGKDPAWTSPKSDPAASPHEPLLRARQWHPDTPLANVPEEDEDTIRSRLSKKMASPPTQGGIGADAVPPFVQPEATRDASDARGNRWSSVRRGSKTDAGDTAITGIVSDSVAEHDGLDAEP